MITRFCLIYYCVWSTLGLRCIEGRAYASHQLKEGGGSLQSLDWLLDPLHVALKVIFYCYYAFSELTCANKEQYRLLQERHCYVEPFFAVLQGPVSTLNLRLVP